MRGRLGFVFSLVPLVLLSFTNARADFALSKAFRESFARGLEPRTIILLAVAGILLIGAVVVVEIFRSEARRKTQARVSWQAFYEKAEKFKLSSGEVRMLEDLVEISDVKNPEAVFTSPNFYEDLIDEMIRIRKANLTDEDYLRYRQLRDKLGYSSLGVEIPFVSSRQFVLGERVLFEVMGQGRTAQSAISEVEENFWVIANPFEEKLQGEPELMMRITRRGDAEYNFRSRVILSDKERIHLEHVRDLERNQLRRFVRVDVNLAVQARVMKVSGSKDTAPEGVFSGRMVDISAGGLSMRLPLRLPANSVLALDFDLPGSPFRTVPVKVIRVSEQAQGAESMYKYSVAFQDMDNIYQEKIVQFAHKKQLEELQWR